MSRPLCNHRNFSQRSKGSRPPTTHPPPNSRRPSVLPNAASPSSSLLDFLRVVPPPALPAPGFDKNNNSATATATTALCAVHYISRSRCRSRRCPPRITDILSAGISSSSICAQPTTLLRPNTAPQDLAREYGVRPGNGRCCVTPGCSTDCRESGGGGANGGSCGFNAGCEPR